MAERRCGRDGYRDDNYREESDRRWRRRHDEDDGGGGGGGGGRRGGLLERLGSSLAAKRGQRQRQQEEESKSKAQAEVKTEELQAEVKTEDDAGAPPPPKIPKVAKAVTPKLVAEYAVDPHGKGHEKEYKLPPTPYSAPVEVAAVRQDRETGAITYEKKVVAFPVEIPKPGCDLTIPRAGAELCGAAPVGLEHLEEALRQPWEGGRPQAEGLDFVCDSGSLQRLMATPYEPEEEWELRLVVRRPDPSPACSSAAAPGRPLPCCLSCCC